MRTDELTLYVCTKCREIDFSNRWNVEPQRCGNCNEAQQAYPVKNLDELNDVLGLELGTIAPLTDLVFVDKVYMGVEQVGDVEIADMATLRTVPAFARKAVRTSEILWRDLDADFIDAEQRKKYSRIAAFHLVEIPMEEKL